MTAARWDSYPSFASQDVFEKLMDDHTKVRGVEKLSPNRWDVTLTNGTVVRVFITDVYTFSASDYAILRAGHPDVDIIVSASMWNHFSSQAEEEAASDEVVTVMLRGDLMSALHEFAKGRAPRN
ncbi:MAG: hypothetical protein M3401_09950 [Actinomycetota bacterium]|nr:hypothetical protein [Actinomycetota bacterium]